MLSTELKIKYIGCPTALFEVAGLRFLTDPTKTTIIKSKFIHCIN